MVQHRSSRFRDGTTANPPRSLVDPSPAEITDIIPFNEFGNLAELDDELDFYDAPAFGAFGSESWVARAPELDDLDDTDNLKPLWLLAPSGSRANPAADPITDRLAYRPSGAVNVTGIPARRGQHRRQTGADVVKGRLLIAAMATGAAAAAAHSALSAADHSSPAVLAADQQPINGDRVQSSTGAQLITVTPAVNEAVASEELARGVAFAHERAEREARLRRPLYVMPTRGILTSGFGYRWGVLHGGIDIANSIGTPIVAAADGVVIAAGPTAGYGMWVKLRHADGTVTLYGHVNTINCSVGERVMAGDQIATIGNRGYSTGPHLHFEVLLGGTTRSNPAPWLAQRGITL